MSSLLIALEKFRKVEHCDKPQQQFGTICHRDVDTLDVFKIKLVGQINCFLTARQQSKVN